MDIDHRTVFAVLLTCAVAIGAAGWWSVRDAAAHSTLGRVASVERVIDGDTFVIAGGDRVRVRNFDTAELRHWECQEERFLAREARDQARRLLTGARVRLQIDGRDRYGRLVADVEIVRGAGAVDFVDAMVDAGHGARWAYGDEPQPEWCPASGAEA